MNMISHCLMAWFVLGILDNNFSNSRASAMKHTLKDLENQHSIISRKDVIVPLPQDQCENLIGKDSSSVLQIIAKSSQNG